MPSTINAVTCLWMKIKRLKIHRRIDGGAISEYWLKCLKYTVLVNEQQKPGIVLVFINSKGIQFCENSSSASGS